MQDLQTGFAKAQQAFQAGELDNASAILGPLIQAHPNQPALYHLTGLILKRKDMPDRARLAFERGIAVNASMPGLHAELASVLADLDEPEEAVAAYDRAIALDPNLLDAQIDRALVRHQHIDQAAGYRDLRTLAEKHPQNTRVLLNLAVVARALGKLEESGSAVARLLAIAPDNPKGLRLHAQLALDRGLPAAALFQKARKVELGNPGSVIGEAVALLAEGDTDAAEALLIDGVTETPSWGEGHQLLAQIRWQSGNSEEFTDSYREALAKEPANIALWSDYIVATARATGHENAIPLYGKARLAAGEQTLFDNLEANSLCELGELDRAGLLYEKLREIDEPDYRLPLIRYCLKTGEFERAQDYGLALVDQGHGPDAWPYISIAWRMMEDPRWGWLEGDREFAQVQDLDDLVPELPALAERLRSLHRWRVHPFEQSLRGGTQTNIVLFTREDPEIRSLVDHIRAAVAGYIDTLPPHDEDHPVLSPSRDAFRFAGSWSVRLTDKGFHVNHIHNQGWISSALYVALPESIGDESSKDGWLALGEPPAEFGLDLPPLKLVEPKPGRLALFPSIMWHGTRPFSAGERLTVAFDVAPDLTS